MRIIEAADVDLIEPFPSTEVRRLMGWLHCYKTLVETDDSPKTEEDVMAFLAAKLPYVLSWGVIDRNNSLGYKHEAPLIGFISAELSGASNNLYMHVASTRKAWGSGLMDQGFTKIISHIFDNYPSVTRLSAALLNSNKPAKAFAKRVGFKQDGLLQDAVTQNGEPKAIAHFGYLRRDYLCHSLPLSSPSSPEESALSLEESAKAASKVE